VPEAHHKSPLIAKKMDCTRFGAKGWGSAVSGLAHLCVRLSQCKQGKRGHMLAVNKMRDMVYDWFIMSQ